MPRRGLSLDFGWWCCIGVCVVGERSWLDFQLIGQANRQVRGGQNWTLPLIQVLRHRIRGVGGSRPSMILMTQGGGGSKI